MNPVMLAVLIVIPAAVVAASSYFCRRFVRRGGSAKKATFAHIAAALLAGVLVCSLALAVSAAGDAPAAADAATNAEAKTQNSVSGRRKNGVLSLCLDAEAETGYTPVSLC